jgi:hypothetical protein
MIATAFGKCSSLFRSVRSLARVAETVESYQVNAAVLSCVECSAKSALPGTNANAITATLYLLVFPYFLHVLNEKIVARNVAESYSAVSRSSSRAGGCSSRSEAQGQVWMLAMGLDVARGGLDVVLTLAVVAVGAVLAVVVPIAVTLALALALTIVLTVPILHVAVTVAVRAASAVAAIPVTIPVATPVVVTVAVAVAAVIVVVAARGGRARAAAATRRAVTARRAAGIEAPASGRGGASPLHTR